jgi:hypothetical protein
LSFGSLLQDVYGPGCPRLYDGHAAGRAHHCDVSSYRGTFFLLEI